MYATRRPNNLIRSRWWTPSLWLLTASAVLLLVAADGGLAAATALRPGNRANAAAQRADAQDSTEANAAANRPDFRLTFLKIEGGQAGRPLSYTVQVRNDGTGSGAVRVTTTLPPEFSNVRVTAPGFACSRQFTASGSDAGTLVTCNRNELASGASAEVSVEANPPSKGGTYRLVATADPRGDVTEGDEGNNQVSANVTVGV